MTAASSRAPLRHATTWHVALHAGLHGRACDRNPGLRQLRRPQHCVRAAEVWPLLPCVQEAICVPSAPAEAAWQGMRAACAGTAQALEKAAKGAAAALLPPQLLFNIYVHAPPDYQGGGVPLPAWRHRAAGYPYARAAAARLVVGLVCGGCVGGWVGGFWVGGSGVGVGAG